MARTRTLHGRRFALPAFESPIIATGFLNATESQNPHTPHQDGRHSAERIASGLVGHRHPLYPGWTGARTKCSTNRRRGHSPVRPHARQHRPGCRELLPLAGQSCIDVKLALREQVTRRPFVRSTNLIWDDAIYCSSLFGDYHEKLAAGDFSQGRLLLMKGNPVTPDTALLVYRLGKGKQGAMSTLDGYHLSNVLRLIGRQTLLILQVGPIG